MKKVVVIGGGFGGLSTAAYLAQAGFTVTILEKNSWVGGRAQTFKKDGFIFDLGPSWYWMPDIFEKFFTDFGCSVSDYYQLQRISPSYRIYFEDEYIDLPTNTVELCKLFEKYEKGAGTKLEYLLKQTQKIYEITLDKFIPSLYTSYISMLKPKILAGGLQLLAQYNGFQSVDSFLKKYFQHPKLIQILEFPIFFLGESPQNIPAVYSMMNHVDYNLGTWFPNGGFGQVAQGVKQVTLQQGASIKLNQEVTKLHLQSSSVIQVETANNIYEADIVVANADYPFIESLLPSKFQSYSANYWLTRKLAPSALVFYLGCNKKIAGLLHHTLFFHHNWQAYNHALFKTQRWPEKPLYYLSCPTKTDTKLAPTDGETLVILIPIPSGLEDCLKTRNKYYQWVMQDLENKLQQQIQQSIVVKKSYCLNDFQNDYHAFLGNAYGLGHTGLQTAVFRPTHKSKKVNNLYYTGQFTNPGIGVPMVLISGKIVAQEIIKKYG